MEPKDSCDYLEKYVVKHKFNAMLMGGFGL